MTIAEIADNLSEAQRRAVIHGHGTLAVCRRLREKGLAERVEGTGMAWSAFPIFSPLGMQVRAHLKEQEHD